MRQYFDKVGLSGKKAACCLLAALLAIVCFTGGFMRSAAFAENTEVYPKSQIDYAADKGNTITIMTDMTMTVGQKRDLANDITFLSDYPYTIDDCTLQSANPSIIATDGVTIYALNAGVTELTVMTGGIFGACVRVTVKPHPKQFTLPASVESVGANAFANIKAQVVVIPEGCKSIGSRAFADNSWLDMVRIPNSVQSIADNAFENNDDVWLAVKENSPAQTYAEQNGIKWILDLPYAPSPGGDYGDVIYRAYAVGQSYRNSTEISTLNGTVHDMQSINSMLGTMTLTQYNVKTAIDRTGSEILSDIKNTFAEADSNDVSLFYYSGHGSYGGYLIGVDGYYISPTRLRSTLDTIPGKKIVLVDACHSGAIIGKSAEADTKNFVDSFINAFSTTSKGDNDLAAGGYYVITACAGSQTSIEVGYSGSESDVYFGVFTYVLTQGCGWDEYDDTYIPQLYADANGDGKLTLSEVYNYTVSGVEYIGFSDEQTTRCYPSRSSQVLFGRE